MSEKITLELKYSIKIDGTETGAVYMRRPKVRDQVLVDKAAIIGKSSAEKEVMLFANLCEISPDDIQELDMADYKKMQDTYVSFLEG